MNPNETHSVVFVCQGGYLKFTTDEWQKTLNLLYHKRPDLVDQFSKRSMQNKDSIYVNTGDDCIFRDGSIYPFACILQQLLGICPGLCQNPPVK